MLLEAKTVIALLAVVTVPDPSIKVTLGNWGVSVGKEPMVTELPTVTVPEMTGRLETVTVDAGSDETVTVPEMAGREPMVTELFT